MDFVGYNPLQNSIDAHLKADFVTTETWLQADELADKKKFIEEIRIDLVELMNDTR
jgi:cell division transport system permease protein